MAGRIVKLLAWNISQGGGQRRQSIAEAILMHAPDVVALTEFVPANAAPFLEMLRALGLTFRAQTQRNGFDYAVCVASKIPVRAVPSAIPLLDESGLWLEVAVPEYGLCLGIVHAPASPHGRMREFLSAVAEISKQRAAGPYLVVGDFNTGIGPEDGPMKNYGDVDRFNAIAQAGFTDVWRRFHGDRLEYTYTFPRTGKVYRIDHALASAPLLPRIRGCHYSHEERDVGLSDHSILMVEIED